MIIRMFKLRLLNAIAPAYFFSATTVTFIFHFYFFIPTIFQSPGISLRASTVIHTGVFLYLMLNALGNYVMAIKYPAESSHETVIPACSADCSDKIDAHYLLNGRHFCKLCKKIILRRDHHCFFTGNCIGNKNMRYFIMFCIYTSCTCLYSLVLGVAFLTVEYNISFENPLTFLTLLPLSTGYFFLGEFQPTKPTSLCEGYSIPKLTKCSSYLPLRSYFRSAVIPGADVVCVAGHRPGVCWVLLSAGAAGGAWADLLPDEARPASGEPKLLEGQPE
uniref:Palmitoyltransferase n=1 Tax=Esox lucius TaxID=8010 RepID=A0AAY5L0V2_ESOLU